MSAGGYTPERLRGLVRALPHLWATQRLPSRGERLVSGRPRHDEAIWAGAARLKADLEVALKRLPLDDMLIVVLALALRDTPLCRRRDAQGWRERVGDLFGLTGGEVSLVLERSLKAMADYLNGSAGGEAVAPDS